MRGVEVGPPVRADESSEAVWLVAEVQRVSRGIAVQTDDARPGDPSTAMGALDTAISQRSTLEARPARQQNGASAQVFRGEPQPVLIDHAVEPSLRWSHGE